MSEKDQQQTETSQVAAIRELVEKHKAKAAAAATARDQNDGAEETKQGAASAAKGKTPIKEIVVDGGDQEDIKMLDTDTTFADLGVCPEICEAVQKMGFTNPSKIQKESLPFTLKGRDIIGLAETGSGKTAAFAIPVI